MPKSDAERAKDYRQKQMETNEMEYREKSKFFKLIVINCPKIKL